MGSRADWERDRDAEEMAGCLGPLQLVAAIFATCRVLFVGGWWLTTVAWVVIAVGMWFRAWRNMTNPWWRSRKEASRG